MGCVPMTDHIPSIILLQQLLWQRLAHCAQRIGLKLQAPVKLVEVPSLPINTVETFSLLILQLQQLTLLFVIVAHPLLSELKPIQPWTQRPPQMTTTMPPLLVEASV